MTSRIDEFLVKVLSVSPEELERSLAVDPRCAGGRGYWRWSITYRPPHRYWKKEGPARAYEYYVFKRDRTLRLKVYREAMRSLCVLYCADPVRQERTRLVHEERGKSDGATAASSCARLVAAMKEVDRLRRALDEGSGLRGANP